MEESLTNYHEDHIAGRGNNSLQHCNLVHKFIPMPQAMKIPAAKAAIRMWETWKDSGVEPDQSQKQIRGDRWSKDQGRKSSFRLTDGHLSFEEWRIGGKAPKIQRTSCIRRRHCERWFWILCSIYRTRIFSISNDSRQNHGYHLQIARLRWTSSGCSIGLYPSENGRCSQIIENSKIGVSRHLDSSTTTQMA